MAFLFPLWSRRRVAASIPAGERIYAIGDIHGEAQLLSELLKKIFADSAARGPADTTLVVLGDFIDRGEGAAEMLTTMSRMTNPKVVILKGNHEAALVDAYRGDADVIDFWMQFGGAATLIGMGATAESIETDDPAALLAILQATIDPRLIDWLDALPTSWTIGDYYFTHAGVRPGVDLDAQDEHDLLWIRDPFLKSRKDHGKVVVHGHTIEPGQPSLGFNRIGIDTGAHEHGQLTAVGLEGDAQWILQASSTERGET